MRPALKAMFTVSCLLASLAMTAEVHADLIDLVPNPHSPIQDIQTSLGGTLNSANGKKVSLTTVGVGLRRKLFLGASLKVYVAQMLVSDPALWVAVDPGALDSMAKMGVAAMVLTLERTIAAPDLTDAFNAGLVANQADLQSHGILIDTDPDIAALLQLLSNKGDIASGSTVMFCFERQADGTELLYYRDQNGEVDQLRVHSGLQRAVFSIWLGIPSDPQLADLKNQLLGGIHEN